MQEAKNHHFVPKLILKPWLIETEKNQLNLRGYWWNKHRNRLDCKIKGMDSFCFKEHLLRLSSHPLGRDALECKFFADIDNLGAKARDALLARGAAKLTVEQRRDFARLLFSLEARCPVVVAQLRKGGEDMSTTLDSDPDIRTAMAEDGVCIKQIEYVENILGQSLEDRALSCIVRLVDNPQVGKRLINAHWMVKRLAPNAGTLVLSDRPLIIIHGYDQPGCTWVLPLTPHAAFIACNHKSNLIRLTHLTDQRFVKETNKTSAARAERYVFSVSKADENWLSKHLKPRSTT